MTRIAAFSDRSHAYLQQVDEKIGAWPGARIAARIEELVRTQDDWRRRCLNLNPAESLMSRRSRALLDSDMATRLTEGVPGDKLYPHGRLNDQFDEIEAIIIALARRQFGAAHVEWRPVSTTMGNAAVFHTLLQRGDTILSQDDDAGGNYVYQRCGPAGLIGVDIVPIPRHGELFEIDVEGLAALAEQHRPKMIVVGGSNVLFPYPLRQMREIADRVGATILYDAAHLSLHIGAGEFQRPLQEGAHIVTFSTSKILGGPVGGLVLTNEADIAERIVRLTFPTLLQTRDLNKLSALAMALAENEDHGAERARCSVLSARALARALAAEGFTVLGRERNYTQTHQLFLHLGAGARTFETRCNEANIMLSDCALTGDMALKRRHGSRIATHEVTRLGMGESEMQQIARLIRRAADGEPAAALREEVAALVARFPIIRYGFD